MTSPLKDGLGKCRQLNIFLILTVFGFRYIEEAVSEELKLHPDDKMPLIP